jgi:hypothetical protein
MKHDNLLFSLLRFAIWGEAIHGEIFKEDFAEVMKLAKEQTVYGLAFDAISQLNGKFDKRELLKAYGMTERLKHRNALVNKELKELVRLFDENNVDYLVVKGQTYGVLYPKPEIRMPGDIDFLIHQTYRNVKKLIEQQFSIKLPEKVLEGEIEFKHEGVSFELHTSLRTYVKKRHQLVWNSYMAKEWMGENYVEIDGVRVRTLSPTLNAAYVFIHLFFHFMREGVALRQLCDWMMVLHHYKNEIDRESLLKLLSDLDLLEACCAFGTILTDHLGLPVSEFPLPIGEADRKWQKKITKDIFAGGNFGKLHHQTHNSCMFKMETLRLIVGNIMKYYRLCPSEIGGLISRQVKINIKLLVNKV